MKQTLIALLAILVFASCEQKTEEAKNETEVAVQMDESVEPIYESVYISETEGNTLIQNYHKYLRESLDIDTNELLTQHLSFMVDAKKLKKYLEDNNDISMLDIYLARTTPDASGLMTLVYVGAKDSIVDLGNGEMDTMYVEQVHYRTSDPEHHNPKVMDHVFPCPTCDTRVQQIGGHNIN